MTICGIAQASVMGPTHTSINCQVSAREQEETREQTRSTDACPRGQRAHIIFMLAWRAWQTTRGSRNKHGTGGSAGQSGDARTWVLGFVFQCGQPPVLKFSVPSPQPSDVEEPFSPSFYNAVPMLPVPVGLHGRRDHRQKLSGHGPWES